MTKTTKIIVFSNHKGGCGKTSSIVNLAGELGRLGYKILVVDLDAQANASLHIGKLHPSEVKTTAADLLLTWIQLINAIPALMRLCAESFQKTPRKVFCNSVFFEDDD